jgi:hypothetical protein
VWANNIGGGWMCLSGVTYTGNVGTKCGTTDVAMSPTSCSPPGCPSAYATQMKWANPAGWDFHLLAGSVAINKGNPSYAPSTDRDGNPRNGPPDAGAYEYRG